MSTVLNSHVGEYAQSVGRFQAASAGLYAGPSMPMAMLGELIANADGIDTGQLVMAAQVAVGRHRSRDKGDAFGKFLREITLGLGAGMVVEFIQGFQDDHDKDAEDRENLVHDAERCAEAIDDTVHVSNSAITEILSAAGRIVDLLASVLMRQRNGVMEHLAPAIASIGESIIEATNKNVADTCRDRDTTIERCYEEMENRCECACETPLPKEAPKVEQCQDDAAPGAQPDGAAPTTPVSQPPAVDPEACENGGAKDQERTLSLIHI